jgi:Copper type II ascorbate-dependent monooxygenase, C-terminal domain
MNGMAKWALVTMVLAACGGRGSASQGSAPTFSKGEPPSKEAPADTVGGFSVDFAPVTVAPGEEQFPCIIFPMTLAGPSHMVAGAKLTVGAGMHHGNITARPKTGEGVRACPEEAPNALAGGEGADILEGGQVLFASSTQVSGEEWQSLPPGDAYRVKDGFEIVARMHYLNATPAPLTIAPKYEWFTVDEAKVTREVAPFAWTYGGFHIPAQSTRTVTGSCAFPGPMHIVHALPHMHKLGTRFTAGFVGGAFDGELFLDSKGYDPEKGVMLRYDPAIDLSQGDGATFSCTWNNTLDKEVGEGTGDNEMCILFGYAWPPASTYSAVVDDSVQTCVYVAYPVKGP